MALYILGQSLPDHLVLGDASGIADSLQGGKDVQRDPHVDAPRRGGWFSSAWTPRQAAEVRHPSSLGEPPTWKYSYNLIGESKGRPDGVR